MADNTETSLSEKPDAAQQISMSPNDRNILRTLAAKVGELANRPIESEKRNLWYKHNDLEPTRPLIFCDPEHGWGEIILDEQLQCQGELAREWEWLLRREIFWGESMGDDRVTVPFFTVPLACQQTDWGMSEVKNKTQSDGAYTWEPPLKDYADLDKIHTPRLTVDHAKSDALQELAEQVLGDLLTVRRKSTLWWSFGLTRFVISLRGISGLMMDFYDHPNGLHQLMSILRDGAMSLLDFMEQEGLLTLNNDDTYVGSGGFGFTRQLPQSDFDGRHVRTSDMWGFCESQETVSVSPELFEQFVFPYQLPIMQRFGLNCYGCCEPLDTRWHVVERFPNLRRVSVSAWADLEKMAQQLGPNYVLSLKPNPSPLSTPQADLDEIRSYLRHAMEITKGCRLEVIMKDNHTLGNNPQNAVNWARIAKEEAERIGA